MEIIPYNDACKDQVIRLILSIQQQEFALPITIAEQPDLQDIDANYLNGKGNFWVARQDGAVVGTISCLFLSGGNAALRKMFVEKRWRGKESHVGRDLLQTLESFCLAHAKTAVYLGTTSRFLAAHRFYEKNGYAAISARELPHDFSIMAVDTKFYRKDLSGLQERQEETL